MELTKKIIFRMYKLMIDRTDRKTFANEGTHNMLTSIQNELGTLMMLATHEGGAGTTNYIFELYQDLDNYKIHADSPQFKQYGQVAQKVLKGREVNELNLQFLDTKDVPLRVSGENNYAVHLTEITIAKRSVKKFKEELKKSIVDSIANEAGTLACYAATTDNSQTKWVILSVYKDVLAQNEHAEKSNPQLADLIIDQNKHQLHVDTMVSQGELKFDINEN